MLKCPICDNKVQYYFSKDFKNYGNILKNADYYKCENCGFVYSKTHYDLKQKDWEYINEKYHKNSFILNIDDYNHRPPYLQQALLIYLLQKYKIINTNKMLDYGSGLNFFEKILEDNFKLKITPYDEYLQNDKIIMPTKNDYDVVFSSAVLEHITSIDTLNNMISYLKSNGVFMFHTLVCEKVPKDSEWFYLLPVHCSFFTNKSMKIFMEKNGFTCSAYQPLAKTWILFKEINRESILEKINILNKDILNNYLLYYNEFVDYWKGF